MAERRGAHKHRGPPAPMAPGAARWVGWLLCLAIAAGVIAAVVRVSV